MDKYCERLEMQKQVQITKSELEYLIFQMLKVDLENKIELDNNGIQLFNENGKIIINISVA